MKRNTIQISDIEVLEQKLQEAIKTSEVSFLEKVLHDQLLFMIPNGDIITKEMDLASHKSRQMIVDYLNATLENIKIIDDTAIVTITYDTKGRMLNLPIEGSFRYIRFWKRFDDGLKVIGGSCFKL
jgi:hypothetical protein